MGRKQLGVLCQSDSPSPWKGKQPPHRSLPQCSCISVQQALVTSVYREIKGLQESEVKNVLPGRGRDEGVSPGFLQQRRGRISCTALSTKSLSCRASLIPRGAFSRGWRGRFGSGTGAAGGLHERRRASFLPPPTPPAPCLPGRAGRAGRALGRCQPRAWQPAALPAPLPCRRGGRCEHHVLGEGTSCWQLQK